MLFVCSSVSGMRETGLGRCDGNGSVGRPVEGVGLLPLLAGLPPLFWAGNFVLGRALHADIPPLALSFWRWALALLILLPFAHRGLRRQAGLLRRHWGWLSVLAVLGVTNYNTFAYLGLQATTATNGVLLASTTPVLIVLLSWLLLGQGVGIRQGFGAAAVVGRRVGNRKPRRSGPPDSNPAEFGGSMDSGRERRLGALFGVPALASGSSGAARLFDGYGGPGMRSARGAIRLGACSGEGVRGDPGQSCRPGLCGTVPLGACLRDLEPLGGKTWSKPDRAVHPPDADLRCLARGCSLGGAAAVVPRGGRSPHRGRHLARGLWGSECRRG